MTSKNLAKGQIPAVEGAFTWPSAEPCFIVSRCKKCGTVSFPKSAVCRNPKCKDKTDVEETTLTRIGKLMSYSLVCYPPPPPFVASQPFTPFAVGEVEFPEGIAILGQMAGCKYEDLRIGVEVETIVDKLYEDEDGNEIVAWKFRPI